MKKEHILVLGFGNPGRGDDGLGPAFAEAVEKLALDHVDVDADYQLVLEDAEAASKHDIVLFVDADIQCAAPFYCEEVEPAGSNLKPGFSTHGVTPVEVVTLAKELFSSRCRGFLIGIRGYEFDEFKETMTEKARENLHKAIDFFEPALRNGSFFETFRRQGTSFTQTD